MIHDTAATSMDVPPGLTRTKLLNLEVVGEMDGMGLSFPFGGPSLMDVVTIGDFGPQLAAERQPFPPRQTKPRGRQGWACGNGPLVKDSTGRDGIPRDPA